MTPAPVPARAGGVLEPPVSQAPRGQGKGARPTLCSRAGPCSRSRGRTAYALSPRAPPRRPRGQHGVEASLRGTAYQREYNELTSLRNDLYGKLGVSVLLTHHTKQIISGKHVDDLHMLNGSSALSGCADAVLLITGKRGSDRYWLTAHGRTFEDVEIAMERTNPMGWRVAGVGTPSLQKRILEILAEHPRGVTATCIHAVIPAVPEDTIRRQLNRWASAGVIKKDGKIFRLP